MPYNYSNEYTWIINYAILIIFNSTHQATRHSSPVSPPPATPSYSYLSSLSSSVYSTAGSIASSLTDSSKGKFCLFYGMYYTSTYFDCPDSLNPLSVVSTA